LVEQRIENPRVGGSIPPQATKHPRFKRQTATPLAVAVFLRARLPADRPTNLAFWAAHLAHFDS
jgi:hypothetical protein